MTTAIKILQQRAEFLANFMNDQTPESFKNELNEINKAIEILNKNNAELSRQAPEIYQTRRGGIHLKTDTNDGHLN